MAKGIRRIKESKDFYINTKNGMLDQEHIQFNKSVMLLNLLKDHLDLVEVTTQEYPEGSKTKLTMEVDMLVYTGDKLRKQINKMEVDE